MDFGLDIWQPRNRDIALQNASMSQPRPLHNQVTSGVLSITLFSTVYQQVEHQWSNDVVQPIQFKLGITEESLLSLYLWSSKITKMSFINQG